MDPATFNVRDAHLKTTKALPNGAATISTDGLDLGAISARGALVAPCEVLVSLPALTTAELPDTKTMIADIVCDNDSGFGSARTIAKEILKQTGAGGTGAAAASARFRLPTDCEEYIRVNVTNSGTGNCSGKSVTVEILF